MFGTIDYHVGSFRLLYQITFGTERRGFRVPDYLRLLRVALSKRRPYRLCLIRFIF